MIKVKSRSRSRSELEELLSLANIRIGGTRPWDIQVRNDRLYDRVLSQGSLGLGEAYMEGWWDCEAQEAKLDLVCRKSGLEPGMTALDIGCGWGSFARFAAEKYGVDVVGVTVAERQVEMGRELCRGLPIEIRLQDYRDVTGVFDRIVSLGMFEHVGYKNYREYMETAHRSLKDGGMFLLHTIGGNKSLKDTDPFIDRHIFPNSMIPSIAQIGSAIEDLFVMEDWHNLSTDYDRTLCSWYGNFERHWSGLQARYGEFFRRMWRYYLLQSAGSFRARKIQVWQIALSKYRYPQYQSIR